MHHLQTSFRNSQMRLLIAFLLSLALAIVANAQTIDTSNISQQALNLLVLFYLVGAIVAVIALIFAALAIRGKNIGEGIAAVIGVLAAIFIIGHAKDWVTTITGQQFS